MCVCMYVCMYVWSWFRGVLCVIVCMHIMYRDV